MVPWIDFSAEHIIQMYNECGLTRFIQFTPLFSRTIRYAQKNTQLLATLQSFGMIWFIGGPLSQADLEWCRINKLTLKVSGFLAVRLHHKYMMSVLTLFFTDGFSFN